LRTDGVKAIDVVLPENAAYQAEQAGPGIESILTITRATLARTKFLLP
jgi:hypothetical protein